MLSLGPPALRAATVLATPLEFSQPNTPWNLQSVRGVPISAVTNVPPGSDGRMATNNESFGSVNPPTAYQFAGVGAFAAGVGLASADWLAMSNSPYLTGSNAFSSTVAGQMRLELEGRQCTGRTVTGLE